MSTLLEISRQHVLVFLLVTTRISGLILAAPLLGARCSPFYVRVLLVLSLAMGGDVRLMILFAVIALSGGQFHLLAKLWYWIMNCRYKVQEDVKQLRLEVAEMAGKE